jgi:hypothetical protein
VGTKTLSANLNAIRSDNTIKIKFEVYILVILITLLLSVSLLARAASTVENDQLSLGARQLYSTGAMMGLAQHDLEIPT